MTALNLNISDEEIKKMVAEAILTRMTPEKQGEILKQTIDYLLRVQSGGGHSGMSPLEDAFRSAVKWKAEEIAREMIADPKHMFRQKIEELINAATVKALADEKLVDKVASTIANALSGSRY